MNPPAHLPPGEEPVAHQQSHEILTAIFHALPDSFAVIDRAGNILEVNDSWRRLAAINLLPGVELDIGQNYLELCNQTLGDGTDHLRAIAQGIRRVLKGELPDFVHEYPSRAAGPRRWYRLRASPLRTTQPPSAVLVCSDITQSREADESLRQAEFKYRSIYENATEGIFQTSLTGRYLSANPMLAKIYGYDSPVELMHAVQNIGDQLYVDPARREKFIKIVEEKGVVFQFESAIRRKDGRIIWISENARAVRNEQGALLYYEGTVEDITELKQAEESLRQAEFKYRSIFENALEGVFQTSATGRYLSANPMMAKIHGYDSPEEMIREIQDIGREQYVDPQRRAEFVRRMEQAGVVSNFEAQIYRQDRSIISVSANARVVRDAHGAVLYYEGTVADITELKKAEEQIRNQAALLDKARDAILVWDLQFHILYWNQSAERIFGWDAHEALGKNARDLIYRDQSTFQKASAAVLAEGGWSGEMKLSRKGGTEVIIETSLTLVRDPSGEPKSILAINTDVTEKMRLQEQVVHAHRLDSIGTLAGGIAHDFNNILSIITGYTQLGRTNVPASHPIQRNLAAIENATQRAAGVVRQILTFSRQQETLRNVIALPPVVEEALQFLRTTLPAKIEIHSEFAPGLPWILADATQIHQIVMNLGTNAAHALRKNGGLIEVRATVAVLPRPPTRAIINLPPGRYVCLEVRDTGCGMDQATLQRIFEPFFTTKIKGEGTGLGMAVVHGIMKSHDGAITVASEPGQGTVFHLFFPVVETKPEEPKNVTSKNPFGHGRRILYVDDEEALVFLATQALQDRGFKITGFFNPLRALATFCANPQDFDAAVLDVSMPRMDGPELARQLLLIRPDFPIAMITGFMQPDDAEKVRTLGIKKIIDKTTSFKRLGVILEQFLGDR